MSNIEDMPGVEVFHRYTTEPDDDGGPWFLTKFPTGSDVDAFVKKVMEAGAMDVRVRPCRTSLKLHSEYTLPDDTETMYSKHLPTLAAPENNMLRLYPDDIFESDSSAGAFCKVFSEQLLSRWQSESMARRICSTPTSTDWPSEDNCQQSTVRIDTLLKVGDYKLYDDLLVEALRVTMLKEDIAVLNMAWRDRHPSSSEFNATTLHNMRKMLLPVVSEGLVVSKDVWMDMEIDSSLRGWIDPVCEKSIYKTGEVATVLNTKVYTDYYRSPELSLPKGTVVLYCPDKRNRYWEQVSISAVPEKKSIRIQAEVVFTLSPISTVHVKQSKLEMRDH